MKTARTELKDEIDLRFDKKRLNDILSAPQNKSGRIVTLIEIIWYEGNKTTKNQTSQTLENEWPNTSFE